MRSRKTNVRADGAEEISSASRLCTVPERFERDQVKDCRFRLVPVLARARYN